MKSRLAISLCALALLAQPASARRLTVEDVVAMAMRDNPSLLAARAAGRAARETQKSAVGRMLPLINLSDEYQHWDSPFSVSFMLPPQGGQPAMSFPPVLARKQDTNAFTASASQPLLGLLHRSEQYLASRESARSSAAQVDTAARELKASLEVGYLRLFEARALEQVALASEKELDEQVQMAEAKLKVGVLTTADVLRVKTAAMSAHEQAIVAESQARSARAALFGAIGLSPDDASIELAEPTSLLEAATATPPAFADGAAHAEAHRPELARATFDASAAHHVERARLFSLLPEIDAEFAWMDSYGQVFLPERSWFVGARATWPIWEWGASWYARQAAKAQAEAATQQVEAERRQIGVEVESGLAQTTAATSAVEVAVQATASAEEAYRVTNAQVRAGTATTTDLLSAEAALTQARGDLARARYEQAITHVQLARALGQD